MAKLRCAEFFSGIGGLHYALKESVGSEHFDMVAAFDINQIANRVYKYNHPDVPIHTVNLEHCPVPFFEKIQADCWLLSPPCQPYTRGGLQRDDQDARAAGLLHLIEVLNQMENPPRFLFLENVLNFEVSRSRHRLVQALANRGYLFEEFLISPLDLCVAIPNDRLRYYLAACRCSLPTSINTVNPFEDLYDQDGNILVNAKGPSKEIVKSLITVLGKDKQICASKEEIPTLGQFLDTVVYEDATLATESSHYWVPEKYITDYHNYRHDVVNPDRRSSTTFTKAYGSKYIIGTGSFLQTARPEMQQYATDDKDLLLTLNLRFFSSSEIARLHALPVQSEEFRFPPQLERIHKYRLLGNSLNVRVVSSILNRLFSRCSIEQ